MNHRCVFKLMLEKKCGACIEEVKYFVFIQLQPVLDSSTHLSFLLEGQEPFFFHVLTYFLLVRKQDNHFHGTFQTLCLYLLK